MKNMASAIPPPLLSLLHAQRAVALEQLPKPPQFYFHSALVKRAEEDMWLMASAAGTYKLPCPVEFMEKVYLSAFRLLHLK